MVRPAGIEPTTLGFGDRYSNPTELRARYRRPPSLANKRPNANNKRANGRFFMKIHTVINQSWQFVRLFPYNTKENSYLCSPMPSCSQFARL